MANVDKHPVGSFCWFELATTDQAGAKKFYTALLGWDVNDSPIGPDDFYSMFKLSGRDAGAAYTMRKEQRAQGVPPHWMVYVAVANADDAVSKAAFTFTFDAGCEYGGGVTCSTDTTTATHQGNGVLFVGFMAYLRAWFGEQYAVTVGGGAIDNPGRYLVLLPPINGATAASGTPYFTQHPGDPWTSWDAQLTFDYMPSEYCTLRAELTYRRASVPYFAGPRGVTPPDGNQGAPGSMVPGWTPDLVRDEPRVTLALEVKL